MVYLLHLSALSTDYRHKELLDGLAVDLASIAESTMQVSIGVPRGVLRVLEHPHQLRHNSQLSTSMINVTDN